MLLAEQGWRRGSLFPFDQGLLISPWPKISPKPCSSVSEKFIKVLGRSCAASFTYRTPIPSFSLPMFPSWKVFAARALLAQR